MATLTSYLGTYGKRREVVFTSSTTWTPPATSVMANIFLVGGGGGGGGISPKTGYLVLSGGGGGGEVRSQDIVLTEPSYDIIIGTGGAGGGQRIPYTSEAYKGSKGGDSGFGNIIVYGGGGGGQADTIMDSPSSDIHRGISGGRGYTIDLANEYINTYRYGERGKGSNYLANVTSGTTYGFGSPGQGGLYINSTSDENKYKYMAKAYNGGGDGGWHSGGTDYTNLGTDATYYGGGGGGSMAYNTEVTHLPLNSGAGFQGYCKIVWWEI